MELLHLLEGIRVPLLDTLFLWVTMLGEEAAAILVLIVFLWCVDKERGYRLVLTFLLSTYLSQFLKAACCIPRPFVQDPTLTPVAEAIPAATGYSFPSGHTQSAGVLYGGLMVEGSKRWTRVLGGVLLFLVAFSRMYLGVHTPLDVGASLVLSLALLLLLRMLFRRFRGRENLVFLGVLALSAVFLCTGQFLQLDQELVRHSVSNLFRLFGVLCGLAVGYWFENRFVRFETKAPFYFQIIKVALGLFLGAGLLWLTNQLGFSGDLWRMIQVSVILFLILGIYPMSFRLYARKKTET